MLCKSLSNWYKRFVRPNLKYSKKAAHYNRNGLAPLILAMEKRECYSLDRGVYRSGPIDRTLVSTQKKNIAAVRDIGIMRNQIL